MKPAVPRQTFARRAFTLIEIMIVVAIIGLIAAVGIPSVLQTFRKEGMRKAVDDVQQVLGDARARAIYGQRTTEVVFYPAEKRMEIADAPVESSSPVPGMPADNTEPTPATRPLPITQGPVVLPANVDIAMLDINLLDYGATEGARVRFFPNGTCDELTLALICGDDREIITLEFSTALASVKPATR